MFAKLLKYEWRSNAFTFWILSAAALGLSVLGGILLRQLVVRGDDLTDTAAFTIGMTLLFIVLSLIAYVIAVVVMLLIRFYKNKFTDEGYLTFTLPVNEHQIFLTSAINMLLWLLISGLVLMVGIVIIVLITTIGVDLGEIQTVIDNSEEFLIGPPAWLKVLSTVVSIVFGVVLPMTCLTVGAVLAKKHKILAAFGVYYLISVAMGILESVLTLASSFSGIIDSEEAYQQLLTQSALITMAVQLAIIVVGYFLSTSLMKRKLNLN